MKWKPAPTLRARFTLQHQNAEGRLDDGRQQPLQARIHLQTGGRGDLELPRQGEQRNRRKRILGANPKRSRSIETRAVHAHAHRRSREPDYAGKGGWYKDTVTVSFTANGDPTLADGSSGSGVEPATLTAPETFNTSG